MAEKKRVLIVTQELDPYTSLSEISDIVAKIPQHLHENGYEIRLLMPRYGTINERRHRLHEVVRLSGMNIIIDDDDYPLIIKVASLPNSRLQVYFLDNDEFFRRKSVFEDAEGKPFEDNAERMAFFCKGALETVKKFGWAPDIVLAHGWMCGMIPMYLKTVYKLEPIFQNSKVVYSWYDHPMLFPDHQNALAKVAINSLDGSADLDAYVLDGKFDVHQGATFYSDGIIQGSEVVREDMKADLINQGKPYIETTVDGNYLADYLEFYNSLLVEEVQG
jgi:starch synthase